MIFLGTGAAELIPDPFCNCPICRDAREHPEHVRLRSCLLVDGETLIDFGPDFASACAKHRLDLTGLKRVFVTHSHEDHFCHCNVELMDMSVTRTEVLDIYLSEGALATFDPKKYGKDLVAYHPVPVGEPFRAGSWTVTAVGTTHTVSAGQESAVNYLLRREDGRKLLYCSDTGFYPQESLDTLAGAEVDVLVLEGTYGSKEDIDPRRHMNAKNFVRMLEIFLERGIITPKTRVFATHINHKHTFTHEAYQAWFHENAPIPVTVAHDGLEVTL